MTVTDERTDGLATRLRQVRQRIAAAAADAGRDPAELTLIAVTKTYPAADVIRLAQLGVTDFGENRDQEAAPKADEVAVTGVAVRWHVVGRLQRNKCRSVARYADLVHSVDSERLARALATAATGRERPLGVFVQVSLDGDPARGGAAAVDVPRVAAIVAEQPSLVLRGVMAVAPLAGSAAAAFARLRLISESLRTEFPQATAISAGMSGDLVEAVTQGATHLRIGSALLGKRAPLR